MDSMLGFKQFIVEMSKRAPDFTNAREAEKLIVSAIRNPHKGSTAGEERANRIAKFVQNNVGKIRLSNLKSIGATDVRSLAHAKNTRQRFNHDSDSHPVEDFVTHTHHEGEDEESSFIDSKAGSSPSGGSYGGKKLSSVIGIDSKDVPSNLPRSKSHKIKVSRDIHDHLEQHFTNNNSDHEMVRRILNVGKDKEGKLNRNEYLLVDNSKGTTLHNKASAFEHLQSLNPTYSVSRSPMGQTTSIHAHFTHPETGEKTKMQISAIGVKHTSASGENITYNIKHQWLNNMKKTGYVPHAELEH